MTDITGQAGVFTGTVPESYRLHLESTIFAPWAERLLDFARVAPGETVLDVASGTGAVARAAAARVGSTGSVIATDLSGEMLSHVTGRSAAGSAEIVTVVAPATELPATDGSIDLVTCQQGLQFMPDAVAAVREMRRILKPHGGRLAVATWLRGPRIEPFWSFAEAIRDTGIEEPYPGAFDLGRRGRTVDELRAVLVDAGFHDPRMSTMQTLIVWDSPAAVARAIAGTPLGPTFLALDPTTRDGVLSDLTKAFSGGDGRAHTEQSAVFALGIA